MERLLEHPVRFRVDVALSMGPTEKLGNTNQYNQHAYTNTTPRKFSHYSNDKKLPPNQKKNLLGKISITFVVKSVFKREYVYM